MVSPCRNNSDFDLVLWIPVQELIIHKNLRIIDFHSIIINIIVVILSGLLAAFAIIISVAEQTHISQISLVNYIR